MKRRRFLHGVVAVGGVAVTGSAAWADWTPTRPLNVIVPYNAGGGTDLYARAIAAAAEDLLPVPVVIVNRSGGGGMTGAIEAAGARPDGNTILMHSSGSFLLRSMFQEADVNPFDSFETIAQVGNLTGALVVPAGSPFQTIDDLVAALKDNPGNLRWSHNGRGATWHVAGQVFLDSLGVEATDVPFQGGAASRAAIIGEQVDFGVMGIQQTTGFENEMRVLGVFAEERDAIRDDVPTMAEQGYEAPIISSPIILFAPNGVDPEIIAGMEAAMEKITATDAFGATVRERGTLPVYRSGADAEANLRAMAEAAAPVIDALRAQSN